MGSGFAVLGQDLQLSYVPQAKLSGSPRKGAGEHDGFFQPLFCSNIGKALRRLAHVPFALGAFKRKSAGKALPALRFAFLENFKLILCRAAFPHSYRRTFPCALGRS